MNVSVKKLRILLANESHCKDIWLWRNDPLTRSMARTSEYIEWNTHKKWYSDLLKDPCHLLLYGLLGDIGIGIVRFEKIKEDLAEVSININSNYRKKGLSFELLSKGCKIAYKKLGVIKIFAEIKKDNYASHKAFEKVGFCKVEVKKNNYLFYELAA